MYKCCVYLIVILCWSAFEIANKEHQRIIGGYDCEKRNPPINTDFMMVVTVYPGRTLCGGTLLNPLWVLSSAMCVIESLHYYVVDAASRDKYGSGKLTWFPPPIKVKEKYLHPEFDAVSVNNNIAVLNLRSPYHQYDENDYIKLPPPTYSPKIGDKCIVMGYGQKIGVIPPPYYPPEVLQCTELKITSIKIQSSTLCTNDNATNICYRDCGGPMICQGFQIGINSYVTEADCKGEACYVIVANYLDFINNTINRGLTLVSEPVLKLNLLIILIFR